MNTTNTNSGTSKPAGSLLGVSLDNDWEIISKIKPAPQGTGGNFSVGYLVKNKETGVDGYLKALDFSGIFQKEDWPRELETSLKIYNLERDILEKCKEKKLKKVVHALLDGQVKVPGFPHPFNNVHYLIFELADGDIRKKINELGSAGVDQYWTIRSLHNTAIGLDQLHRIGITHQDLKPSNVLNFEKKKVFKIADLGCASDRELGTIYPAGDMGYSPPEIFYKFKTYDDFETKKAADLYLLGSLIFFHFTGVSLSQAIRSKIFGLEPNFSESTFDNDIVVFQRAFGESIRDLKEELINAKIHSVDEIISLAQQLANPDPRKRGYLKLLNSNGIEHLSLERFVSKFSVLMKRAEFGRL